MPDRLSWNQYFAQMAELVAKRSTCLKQPAGAILVKNNQIIATGYAGAPKGLPHCKDAGCLRQGHDSNQYAEQCRGVHAEQNAIIQATLHGVSTEDATLYCTHYPCSICARMIINAKIAEIYVDASTETATYADKMAVEMLGAVPIIVHGIMPGTGEIYSIGKISGNKNLM